MTFPGLPFDRLPKFIFIGSLALLALMFSTLWQNDKTYQKEKLEVKQKQLDLLYEIKMDTVDLIYGRLKTHNDSLRLKDSTLSEIQKANLISEIRSDVLSYIKKYITVVKKKDDSKYLDDRLNSITYSNSVDETLIYSEGAIFLVILVIGLGFWIKEESVTILATNRKINFETKNISCQSCGMILKYDLHPHMEAEFCSTCYDGEKYKEPDLTYDEMSKRVQAKLKGQFTEKQIKKQLKVLEGLNRWANTLRW